MLFTYFDVETSGLHVGCDVLSFSYILGTEDMNVKRAETLYFWKEGVTQWGQEAYEVNGLSKEFLRQHEADYDKNLKKMYLVLSYGDLVGYNSGHINKEGIITGFDFPVIKDFLERNHLYTPQVLGFYDVMHIGQVVYKQRLKLQTMFDKIGCSREIADAMMAVYFNRQAKAHDAAYDTVCTSMIFQKLCEEGYIRPGEKGVANLLEDVGERGLEEYRIEFDADKGMLFVDTYEGTVYTASEFLEKFPKLFDEMMANPSTYM